MSKANRKQRRKEVLPSGKRTCDVFGGAVSAAPRSGLYAIVYVRVASPTVIWQQKDRLHAFIEPHFRGSKPLQIFTKLRPIIVYIYTTVACASAARSAFNLTAETQRLSWKVHSIGTTEPMRLGGTSAQTSPFISIA